jgi:hypothetical protein
MGHEQIIQYTPIHRIYFLTIRFLSFDFQKSANRTKFFDFRFCSQKNIKTLFKMANDIKKADHSETTKLAQQFHHSLRISTTTSEHEHEHEHEHGNTTIEYSTTHPKKPLFYSAEIPRIETMYSSFLSHPSSSQVGNHPEHQRLYSPTPSSSSSSSSSSSYSHPNTMNLLSTPLSSSVLPNINDIGNKHSTNNFAVNPNPNAIHRPTYENVSSLDPRLSSQVTFLPKVMNMPTSNSSSLSLPLPSPLSSSSIPSTYYSSQSMSSGRLKESGLISHPPPSASSLQASASTTTPISSASRFTLESQQPTSQNRTRGRFPPALDSSSSLSSYRYPSTNITHSPLSVLFFLY